MNTTQVSSSLLLLSLRRWVHSARQDINNARPLHMMYRARNTILSFYSFYRMIIASNTSNLFVKTLTHATAQDHMTPMWSCSKTNPFFSFFFSCSSRHSSTAQDQIIAHLPFDAMMHALS
jgi:hypothetical protein